MHLLQALTELSRYPSVDYDAIEKRLSKKLICAILCLCMTFLIFEAEAEVISISTNHIMTRLTEHCRTYMVHLPDDYGVEKKKNQGMKQYILFNCSECREYRRLVINACVGSLN